MLKTRSSHRYTQLQSSSTGFSRVFSLSRFVIPLSNSEESGPHHPQSIYSFDQTSPLSHDCPAPRQTRSDSLAGLTQFSLPSTHPHCTDACLNQSHLIAFSLIVRQRKRRRGRVRINSLKLLDLVY